MNMSIRGIEVRRNVYRPAYARRPQVERIAGRKGAYARRAKRRLPCVASASELARPPQSEHPNIISSSCRWICSSGSCHHCNKPWYCLGNMYCSLRTYRLGNSIFRPCLFDMSDLYHLSNRRSYRSTRHSLYRLPDMQRRDILCRLYGHCYHSHRP